MSSALERLKNLTSKITSYELSRKQNLIKLEKLYSSLGIDEKVDTFVELFGFKAINLSGISLSEDSLGKIQEGKYVQLIAISYDSSAVVKNKNSSLGYFGRSEKVEDDLRYKIINFVLCWRFEKSFRTLEHYNTLIDSLPKDE